MKRTINEKKLQLFVNYLREDEKSNLTIDKYVRDIRTFARYAEKYEINKKVILRYKDHLKENYAVASANSMIAALNHFFRFCGWNDLCIKQFKVQKKAFCSVEKELTKDDYKRLVKTAEQKNNERLALVIQTICGTGIRVSELTAITVEAVQKGQATVSCKGKTRMIFIISALRKKLLKYARACHITSGAIFITKSGKPMSRCNIWKEMKSLCVQANVSPQKVFPHNLRHLFARTFYRIEKDIAKLADILGHSSINTTRIYIMSTGSEHRCHMESMRLVI